MNISKKNNMNGKHAEYTEQPLMNDDDLTKH